MCVRTTGTWHPPPPPVRTHTLLVKPPPPSLRTYFMDAPNWSILVWNVTTNSFSYCDVLLKNPLLIRILIFFVTCNKSCCEYCLVLVPHFLQNVSISFTSSPQLPQNIIAIYLYTWPLNQSKSRFWFDDSKCGFQRLKRIPNEDFKWRYQMWIPKIETDSKCWFQMCITKDWNGFQIWISNHDFKCWFQMWITKIETVPNVDFKSRFQMLISNVDYKDWNGFQTWISISRFQMWISNVDYKDWNGLTLLGFHTNLC